MRNGCFIILFLLILTEGQLIGQPYPLSSTDFTKNNHTVASQIFPEYLKYNEVADSCIPYTLRISRGNNYLYLTPDINSRLGYDFSGKRLMYQSETGIRITGTYGTKLSAEIVLSGGFSQFSRYADSIIQRYAVVPGTGFATKRADAVSYTNHRFFVTYRFSRYILGEAGFGKNFWGDGYRSLFLSENASAYPYVKFRADVWRLHYACLWAGLSDITTSYFSNQRMPHAKYGSFHYLTWDVNSRLNLNFFEAVIWQNNDTLSVRRGFDVHYANPVILYRPVEFALGSPDNSLFGLGFAYRIGKSNYLYGQVLVDDIIFSNLFNDFKHIIKPKDTTILWGSWMSKQALQLGFKTYRLFNISGLSMLAEINVARPYTYSHHFPIQNYAHFNEALAHPIGSNFKELAIVLKYSAKKWQVHTAMSFVATGLDSGTTHYGQNIFNPTFDAVVLPTVDIVKSWGNNIAQGIPTNLTNIDFRVYYTLVEKMKLRAFAGFTHRSTKVEGNDVMNETSFYTGIKTSLSRLFWEVE